MKKFYLLILLLVMVSGSFAQDISKAAALELVAKNSKALALTPEDIDNSLVSSAYFNKTSGTELVYLQQSFKGLPVYNQIQTLAFKNGSLVYKSGSRIHSMQKRTNDLETIPTIDPENAIKTAMLSKKLSLPAEFTIVSDIAGKRIYEKIPGITSENISTKLLWVPDNIGVSVKLAWQIYLVPATTSDYWMIRVDANTGNIIDENNLTVYCNFDHVDNHEHETTCTQKTDNVSVLNAGIKKENSIENLFIVNGASYRVIPYPAESPIHPGGAHALVNNPWTLAPGNATSLKWHSDGTNDWTYTRGNNVWAYHDRHTPTVNTPFQFKSVQSSTTPDPLTFDFIPNYSITPTDTSTAPNRQFNTTNLFYWNNIIHDLVYQYGFDEVAGNFQANNQGRGGLGNDYVRAEAQDAGGTNNANFSTPEDGSLPRMQMYLWSGSPQKDGDVDNGIITHEFAHGISNRLTGGPAESGCLSSSEQMGEGWSDYYSLMATQDWANSLVTDGFNKPRGIGTYALGQPITGLGIRSQRYCTNFAVNNKVYTATIPNAQHDRGEIWCAALWDMTWNIINQVGSINPDLFNATGTGGNSIALKLVTEGMKLQPCNPGFLDGRDAILQADQLLYNGAYRCAIWTAFARRGMGFDAVQGSPFFNNDQVSGFSTGESYLASTQNVTQQLEGLNITYTNTVKTLPGSCTGLTNYLLTDTLPTNVTYVSGGTYNATTRVVSFPVNQLSGQSQNYSFTVQINNGSYYPTTTLINEQVSGAGIPATWVASSATGATNFVVSSAQSHSAPNSFFGGNSAASTDFRLTTASAIPMGPVPPLMSFWHNYNTEKYWDGGVVEISTNGGSTWSDLGPVMTENKYPFYVGTGSGIGGRRAFTGNSNGWIKTSINLVNYANQNALFRFRMASDNNTAGTGWFIDDILIESKAIVNMRSNLFNTGGTRVYANDTVTVILENAGCTPVSIITAPSNTNACVGTNATFSIAISGTTPSYQWEVSTDGGTTWNTISGATSSSLTVNNVTLAMNNNRYRVQVNNACPSNFVSSGAILTVTDAASITNNPADATTCLNSNTSFSVTASGSTLTYQWQVSTDGGTTWTNIAGATTATYNLSGVTAAMNNNRYRAVVFSCGPAGTNSAAAILTVTNPANITAQPATTTVCPGNTANFSVTVNGTALTYQWQVSTNGGANYVNIGGATASTLSIPNVTLTMNNNRYRVIINGTCTVDLISNGGILNVNQPVSLTAEPGNKEVCAGDNVTFTVEASGTSLSYQWQVSINGNPFVNLSNTTPYSGVNTNTLTITGVTVNMNNYRFRAIVDGPPCGAVTSAGAVLTVNSLPGAVLVAAEYSTILPYTPSGLYVTVSPAGNYTYQWYRNNDLIPGVTGSSYPLNLDRLGSYTVTAIDANGCGVTTNLVTIRDSASNQLFIYPNPNQGQFQVRFYNPSNAASARTLVVYDAKGAKVYSGAYTITGPYDMMMVDMPKAAAGSYIIYLLDAKGNKLATGKVVIQR